MSYESAMFHRMAEEMHRIAYETNEEHQLDDDDLHTVADALAFILVNRGHNELAEACACVTATAIGGMYEVFQELPDAKEHLFRLLMDKEGFRLIEDERCEIWIRENN